MEAAHEHEGEGEAPTFSWLSRDAPGESPALRFAEHRLTYGDLRQSKTHLGHQLQAQFEPGTLLALWLPNGPELISLILAGLDTGAVVPMPVAADTPTRELCRVLQHARCRHLVVSAETATALRPEDFEATSLTSLWQIEAGGLSLAFAREPAPITRPSLPSDAALVLHSSGSSGAPKGVVLSQRAVVHIVRGRLECAQIDRDTRALVASSLAHSVGLYQALAYLSAGAFFELLPSYALPTMAERLNAIRPTHLILVVGALDTLLESSLITRESLASLRFAAVGADRVPQHLQQRFHALTGRTLAVSYGMTELSWILFQNEGDLTTASSLGHPAPGVEVRLQREDGEDAAPNEIGEILARSPKALSAYLHDEAGTVERLRGGWVHSGDLAWRDEVGRYWYAGRISDLICLASGDLVSPIEVEQAIVRAHAAIRDALVVGMPSNSTGESEVPWALIVAEGDPTDLEATLEEVLAEQLSAFKRPRRLLFVDQLPIRPGGKRSRRAARQWLLDREAS